MRRPVGKGLQINDSGPRLLTVNTEPQIGPECVDALWGTTDFLVGSEKGTVCFGVTFSFAS